MSYDEDLSKLMHLVYQCIQSEMGKSIPEGDGWKNDAQVLGTKIFRHVASAQQVSAGISFDFGDGYFSHIDHSSVAVIVRAAVEALLAFKYIFINDDISLSVFRHKLWKLSGLSDRSKMLSVSSGSKVLLEDEAEIIRLLKQEVYSSQFYINSNRDDRREMDNCSWKPKGGVYKVSGQTDIHQGYFSNIYNHLSGHVHASYISVLQTRDARDLADQQMLAGSIRQTLCMVLAHFLISYTKLFSDSTAILQSDPDLFNIVKNWHFRSADFDGLYEKSALS